MSERITPGQERIRVLVQQALPDYVTTKRDSHAQAMVFLQLRQAMQADAIISTDSITGTILGYVRIADSYCRWLETPHTAESSPTKNGFRLDRFIYDYAIRGTDIVLPAYTGGMGGTAAWGVPSAPTHHSNEVDAWYLVRRSGPPPPLSRTTQPKWASTYWTLFELARTGQTPEAGEPLSLIYHEAAGILRAGSGGNHRTLAHVLWGQSTILWDRLTHYRGSAPFDDQLNTALLTLEHTICAPWWKPGSASPELATLVPHMQVQNGKTQDIIAFVQDTSREELIILRDYVRHIRHESLTIDWLSTHRDDLRQCRTLAPQRSWIRRLQDRIQNYEPIPSDFEQWYQIYSAQSTDTPPPKVQRRFQDGTKK